MERNGREKWTCLCDLDLVNLEFCVWMRLLCVEHLLYGDGSEGVFAICSLNSESAQDPRMDSMIKIYLSSSTLASALRTSQETPSTCPALSSIGRRGVAAAVICKGHVLEASDCNYGLCSPMLDASSTPDQVEERLEMFEVFRLEGGP